MTVVLLGLNWLLLHSNQTLFKAVLKTAHVQKVCPTEQSVNSIMSLLYSCNVSH